MLGFHKVLDQVFARRRSKELFVDGVINMLKYPAMYFLVVNKVFLADETKVRGGFWLKLVYLSITMVELWRHSS